MLPSLLLSFDPRPCPLPCMRSWCAHAAAGRLCGGAGSVPVAAGQPGGAAGAGAGGQAHRRGGALLHGSGGAHGGLCVRERGGAPGRVRMCCWCARTPQAHGAGVGVCVSMIRGGGALDHAHASRCRVHGPPPCGADPRSRAHLEAFVATGPSPLQVQGVLSSAAERWPHIHVSDSLVMADMAVRMAEAGCRQAAPAGWAGMACSLFSMHACAS